MNVTHRVADEMDDLIAMSNELGESLGRTYEVPDSIHLLVDVS